MTRVASAIPERTVLGASVENQVIARGAAHVFVGLLAHDPEEGVDDVRLAAAVRSDNTGDSMIEMDYGLVLE